MKVTNNEQERKSFSLRDADREVGARAMQDAIAEKARMRGFKYKQLSVLIPFYARRLIGCSLTLSLRERGLSGTVVGSVPFLLKGY